MQANFLMFETCFDMITTLSLFKAFYVIFLVFVFFSGFMRYNKERDNVLMLIVYRHAEPP